MGNKEEQGLSPAVASLTLIQQPAYHQPGTSQPTSWDPSWKEVVCFFFCKFVSFMSCPEWRYSLKQPPVARLCCHCTFIHLYGCNLTSTCTHTHTHEAVFSSGPAHLCRRAFYYKSKATKGKRALSCTAICFEPRSLLLCIHFYGVKRKRWM